VGAIRFGIKRFLIQLPISLGDQYFALGRTVLVSHAEYIPYRQTDGDGRDTIAKARPSTVG